MNVIGTILGGLGMVFVSFTLLCWFAECSEDDPALPELGAVLGAELRAIHSRHGLEPGDRVVAWAGTCVEMRGVVLWSTSLVRVLLDRGGETISLPHEYLRHEALCGAERAR